VCHGGHGWAVEPEPEGAPPAPAGRVLRPPRFGGPPPPPAAVAASFAHCELAQDVNLVTALTERGWGEEEAVAWLDGGPALVLTVWVAARADSGAEASVSLVADSGDFAWPPYHGSAAFDWAGRALAVAATGARAPRCGAWTRVRLTLTLPSGARRVVVVLGGRDPAFWAGHYGPKFRAPELTFAPGGPADDGARSAVPPGADDPLPPAPPRVVDGPGGGG